MYKLLLVDDDRFLRELYTEILKAEDIEITIAEEGIKALELMSGGGWDLVLLDIALPSIDGITLLQTLKKTPPKIPNKKIVFLTNHEGDKEVEKNLSLADGYIVKNRINPEEFTHKVRSFLATPK